MKKQAIKQLTMTLLSVVLICYLVLQLALNVGDIVEIEHATYASAVKKTELKAFVFRNETVMTTSATGVNCFFFDDGERIRRDERVAITYSEARDANVQEQIKDINDKISVLEQSGISSGASTTDISKIDSIISGLMMDIIRAVDKNNLDKAIRSKEELTIQTNRRQALIMSRTDYKEQIKELEREKESLERTLTGASVTHRTSSAGYFYSVVDGYENSFTMDKLESLTISEYDALSELMPDQNLISSAVGKLVLTPEWYIVCEVDKRTASGFDQGRTYNFAFPYSAGTILGMRLVRTVSQTDLDRVLLVFTTREMPQGFNYSRTQTVELITSTYEGLRISVSALRKIDGETGVYAVDGNKIIFKRATVLCEENGYYICALPQDPNYPDRKDRAYVSRTQLSLYDAVISSGRNLYEGKILQ